MGGGLTPRGVNHPSKIAENRPKIAQKSLKIAHKNCLLRGSGSGPERGAQTDGEVCPEMGWESPGGVWCVAPFL
jgi:hypothetical protein